MKDISMRFLNENTLEKLAYDAWLDMREARTEEELKEATQSAKYVEEEIRLTGNEDLYKYALEFNSYANTVKERLERLKVIER